MCLFCAAIPVAGTAAVVAKGKQQEKLDDAKITSESNEVQIEIQAVPANVNVLMIKLSLVLVLVLITGSITYHVFIAPKLGIW